MNTMNGSKSVLILQHAECERPYLISEVLSGLGFGMRTIRPDLGEKVPEALEPFAGLVIMGGPQSVYETDAFPYLAAETRLVQNALQSRRPILGVCLGSQLLASALGAKVYQGSRREIGWLRVSLSNDAHSDPIWTGSPDSFMGFHWHGDVFDLPNGAMWLASSDITTTQAFSYGGFAYGLLLHLEVTESAVSGMIDAFPHEVADGGTTGEAIRADTAQHLAGLQMLGRTVFTNWATLL